MSEPDVTESFMPLEKLGHDIRQILSDSYVPDVAGVAVPKIMNAVAEYLFIVEDNAFERYKNSIGSGIVAQYRKDILEARLDEIMRHFEDRENINNRIKYLKRQIRKDVS